MKYPQYNHKEIEQSILHFWEKQKILEKHRGKNKEGKKFYFLEGPPYTSGRVHLGTAWNMSLKDIVLRYKRKQGFNVWDRMGYDMHGLPTEQKVMKKLNLQNKQDIETYGVKKFTEECEKFCKEMMLLMNKEFISLGSTLDYSNPYQPISKEFMEAEWWLIKQAHEKGRLYQGLRTMHWDAATQSSVAKHELEYKTIRDTSLHIKFPHKDRKNTFFIIWTTTPWTIPLNLAIMVNPDLTYVDVSMGKETWILAKELAEKILEKAQVEKYTLSREYLGKELAGQGYTHPLDIKKYLPQELQKNPKLFTVLLTSEYVDATAGTGLVHSAPGCGPEDYEVGHRNGIPPFNCVDEAGTFQNFGPFSGWKAKADDPKFITAIEVTGMLVAKEPYVHEYPHGERSHQPVIFRTTKQWFFKVEDLKDKMLKANEKVYWHPDAGKNAFRSWLENLRDNSITKQRYWGTPVPIWQAADGDVLVVGSVAELEQLSGKKIKNMHIPDIDTIIITKKGKTYTRIPDVLDVWIDAGTVSWNCLDYPHHQKLFAELFPADFILEGKDQIRGWFNLLMVASFLALNKPAFKNVYMHGFLNDVSGVKMSKSLGNTIAPDELIEKHGTDVLRYYMCQTTAGEDINFSWDECAVKQRQLNILWNIHKLLLNLSTELECNPAKLSKKQIEKNLGVEEKYILSKLHSTLKTVTELLEEYKIDLIIAPLEDLYLELSRTYIQLVRDKSSIGSTEERQVCVYTLHTVLLDTLNIFSIISPFICEAMYQNLKEAYNLPEESISHHRWPKYDHKKINSALEEHMEIAQNIIQAGLHAREKAKLGLRWPVQEIIITSTSKEVRDASKALEEILCTQLNAKRISSVKTMSNLQITVKPNPAKIGPVYGKLSGKINEKIATENPTTIVNALNQGTYSFISEKETIKITPDMVTITKRAPPQQEMSEFKGGEIFLNTERTPALEAEGYARELMRHVQQLRKNAGLDKWDAITLDITGKIVPSLSPFTKEIKEKVGAKEVTTTGKKYHHTTTLRIKDQEITISLQKVA